MRAVVISLVLLAGLDLPSSDSRMGVRVSAPMATTVGGDVLAARVSPDKRRVVYTGYRGPAFGFGGAIELYSAPLDGGAPPVRISGMLAAGRAVGGFLISPDATRVVYWADAVADERVELFSVPIAGGTPPVRLSGTLASGGDVAIPRAEPGVQITPDSSRVVYLADALADEVYELFSVPIDGGAAPARLNHALAPGQDVGYTTFSGTWRLFLPGFQVTPDGTRVLYLADQSGRRELWIASLAGAAAPMRLSHALPSDSTIGSVSPHEGRGYFVSPDSGRVVYLVQRAEELWSVPTDGSLAPVLVEQAPRIEYDVQISADSKRVLYRAGSPYSLYELRAAPLEGGAPPSTLSPPIVHSGVSTEFLLAGEHAFFQQETTLYRVPIDGGAAATPLATNAPAGGASLRVTADGTRVVYFAGRLFSVVADGGAAPVALTPPGAPLEFALAPDGAHVVYRSDAEDPGTIELYSVRVDGRLPPSKLNPPLVPGGDVQSVSSTDDLPDFEIVPDSRRVLYLADQDAPDVVHVHVVPIDASLPPLRLSAPLGQPYVAGDVAGWQPGTFAAGIPFQFDAGGRIVYLADQDVDELQQLYTVVAPRSGPPLAPVRLSGALEYVYEFRLAGGRAVYRFHDDDPIAGYHTGLASVPLDGSAEPAVLHVPLEPTQQVLFFEIAPDASRVVYLVTQDAAPSLAEEPREGAGASGKAVGVWSVPLDGGALPTLLSDPAAELVWPFAVSPDSTRVVFGALRGEEYGLWAAPIDGGSAPLLLHASANELRRVAVTPDSRHVVFTRRLVYGEDLRSVPIDGGPVRALFDPPVYLGGVDRFLPSPDSTQVVFGAGQPRQLYAVPVEGGRPPVVLNGALVPDGEVHTSEYGPAFRISADGSRVVYCASERDPQSFELFSAPLTTRGPPAFRVSGPLVPGGDVSSFQLGPDGERVVFQANVEIGNQLELLSASLAVEQAPVRLDPRGDSFEFRVSGDGRRVVYRARGPSGAGELYDVALEGGPVRRLDTVTIPGGLVTGFEPSGDGRRVLYRADAGADEVFELYLTDTPTTFRRER